MTKLSKLVSRRLVISVVFGLSVSSCASFTANDYPKLIDEVERQIETGMDVRDASKRLERRGFSCRNGSVYKTDEAFLWECTRFISSLLPFSCLHRVWLVLDSEKQALRKIRIFKPACAGL